jgi:quercetin dioxygenase-like cupin family protein
LVPNDSILNCVIGSVTFEAGARTNWHYHPGGQILLVTAGTGRYQEKGKKVQIIRTGDVIKCLPNIEHWHGATQDGAMTHLAISLNTHKGIVTWLRSVTDQEYTPGN